MHAAAELAADRWQTSAVAVSRLHKKHNRLRPIA